jgi:hypothetical protein
MTFRRGTSDNYSVAVLTNQINRNLVHLKKDRKTVPISLQYTLHTHRDLDDYIHDSTNYRKKIFSSISARCKVRPRPVSNNFTGIIRR